MPRVLVIVPTVTGREEHRRQCVSAYLRSVPDQGPLRIAVSVIRDRPTCGEAWNDGADALRHYHGDDAFDYIHFTADDLLPQTGWLEAAIACWKGLGAIPNPFLYNTDGTRWGAHDGANGTNASFPRVPFLPVTLWNSIGQVPPIHYFSDVYLGAKALEAGIETLNCAGYAFTHTWAQEGRLHERETEDRRVYDEWMGSR